jgi:hypothetical protein
MGVLSSIGKVRDDWEPDTLGKLAAGGLFQTALLVEDMVVFDRWRSKSGAPVAAACCDRSVPAGAFLGSSKGATFSS